MNLQKYNPQQNLEVVEQIKVALTSSMVKDTPKKGLFDYVTNAITRLYAAARFTAPSPEEMNVIVGETFKVIVEFYPTLRYQELDVVFRKGLIGEYGEYKGLSVPTFASWIKAYMVDKVRLDQLPKPLQLAEKCEPSREQKFDLAANNAIDAFNKYKTGGDISISASSVYKTLLKLNLVNYSEEEVAEFMEQARLDVVEELTISKNLSVDKIIRQKFQRMLDGGELQEKIVIQARRLGCYEYFKYLIIEEIDLASIMDDKRKEIFGEGENG